MAGDPRSIFQVDDNYLFGEQELVLLLKESPLLMAITLLEHLQYQYPGEYPDKLLRTLERRVRKWKAVEGPQKEVIFRQNIPPGWQSISLD